MVIVFPGAWPMPRVRIDVAAIPRANNDYIDADLICVSERHIQALLCMCFRETYTSVLMYVLQRDIYKRSCVCVSERHIQACLCMCCRETYTVFIDI